MNIAIINKQTNICENIAVFASVESAQEMFGDTYVTVEQENGYGIGDTHIEGVWSKKQQLDITSQQQRESAYETMLQKEDGTPVIEWEEQGITVDTANKKWLDYSAEGSQIANELSALIVAAKAYIRELYPDL